MVISTHTILYRWMKDGDNAALEKVNNFLFILESVPMKVGVSAHKVNLLEYSRYNLRGTSDRLNNMLKGKREVITQNIVVLNISSFVFSRQRSFLVSNNENIAQTRISRI